MGVEGTAEALCHTHVVSVVEMNRAFVLLPEPEQIIPELSPVCSDSLLMFNHNRC